LPEKAAERWWNCCSRETSGRGARDAVLGAGRAATADGLRKAVQLIVHCPEYQLA